VQEYSVPVAILVNLQNGRLDITACLHQVSNEIGEKCYTTMNTTKNERLGSLNVNSMLMLLSDIHGVCVL